MKNQKILCVLLLIFVCASCAKDQLSDPPDRLTNEDISLKSSSPKIKIAVISDIHYLDETLMPVDYVNNTYFQTAMAGDRKLIELSDPIFRKAMSEIIAEKPDLLMITGDMTCNGELASHLTMKDFLEQIENQGIKVYVVPGNNDIRSTKAKSYKSPIPENVASITPGQFTEIYWDFGYEEAIARDDSSLSYICQPYNGLWILGIDNCKYVKQANGSYKVKAALNETTLDWIRDRMTFANETNIRVLTMMHHGIMEHYTGQYSLEGGLIENYTVNSESLINAGITLVFSAHFHGNDVTNYIYDGKTLTDIETGSLVTPLSPYRILTLDDNFIKIETRRITEIDAILPGNMDFQSYSDSTINSRLDQLFTNVAMNWFGHSLEEAQIIAPFASRAWMAHFAGDEKISPEESRNIEIITEFANPALIGAIKSIWTDLPPYYDNKIHIKLK